MLTAFILLGCSSMLLATSVDAQVPETRSYGKWEASREMNAMTDEASDQRLRQETGSMVLAVSCAKGQKFQVIVATTDAFGDSTSRLTLRFDGGALESTTDWKRWKVHEVLGRTPLANRTMHQIDGVPARRFLRRMRAGRILAVELTASGTSPRQAVFTLNGVTAASTWLECE